MKSGSDSSPLMSVAKLQLITGEALQADKKAVASKQRARLAKARVKAAKQELKAAKADYRAAKKQSKKALKEAQRTQKALQSCLNKIANKKRGMAKVPRPAHGGGLTPNRSAEV